MADTKYYIEWHERIAKWVVKYKGQIVATFDTKIEAHNWGRRNFLGHGHEEERVVVRGNSPTRAKVGEWM